jgi:hypothetical protein
MVLSAFTACRRAQWPPVMRASSIPRGRRVPVEGIAGVLTFIL